MDQNLGSPPSGPPANPTPPVIWPPPPPRPAAAPPPAPRRGRGWMVFALVLLALLGLSLLWNGASLLGWLPFEPRYTRVYGARIEEALVSRDPRTTDKIAVVPVEGIITSQPLDQGGVVSAEVIKAELKRALDDDDVKAVILKVDSPGGEVLASDEIYRAVVEFQKRRSGKPVIASMSDVAASGGYYVASPCRWIVANELTITGSIGVIMHTWNYRGLMDKVGVRPVVYKSGRYKDMLSGDREPDQVTSEERKMLQDLIDQTFGRFKTVVGQGRQFARDHGGRPLSDDWASYADGRVLSGREAYHLGFVDQLGTFDDAVERARKIAGLSAASVVRYQQRFDLADLFRLFGKTEAKAVKLDLGIEVPKLRAGQLYYLSTTFLR